MIPRTPKGFVRRHTRKLLRLDGRLPSGHSLAPDHVYLIPTLRCDLRCPYCFQRDMPHGTEDLDLEGWRDVIAQIRPFGSTVVIMGGELFLFRPIVDLMRAVKAADLPLVIITNGTLLAKQADELLALGLDGLYVSIDGPPEAHNAVRGHPRGYELATKGVARILEGRGRARRPFVQVFTTISGYTVGHLQRHAADMMRLGVDRLVLNALVYFPPHEVQAQAEALCARFGVDTLSCPAIDDTETPNVDPEALGRELEAIAAAVPRRRFSIDPPDIARRPEVYFGVGSSPFRTRGCVSAYRDMWIYPSGDVSACVRMNELVMGNVKTETLAGIWNGPTYRRFRHRLSTEGALPVCGRCVR